MYTFTDDGDRSRQRPEGTAGAVRAYIEHGMHNNAQPTKRIDISPTFRCENTQAGRQRQFHQFGVEMLGSYSAAQDAEAISVAAAPAGRNGHPRRTAAYEQLGLSWNVAADTNKVAARDSIGNNLQKLCPTCKERFEIETLCVFRI